PLPADTPEGLRTWMTTGGSTTGAAGRSLESYLRRFDVTLAVLQDADALERVAYELVLDHAAENVRWVEVRFCPLLNTENGMTPEGAVDAALRGLRRAEQDADVRAAVIVCALRTL
ncbi:MAG: adenosine deaminase, partial [Gammaproteobacteria bacterium]|nr:adenosine deaminase [Gemmatimonadota bacterium]NIU75414.1 adenosine deaminase [Gammaproteobacteria bacterium]